MSSATVARLARRQITVGIRREDPKRIWERRCPLTPDAVHELVRKDNVQVHVEGCTRRVFPDSEFVKAGASIVPNLNKAHILLGIKEPPLAELQLSPIDGVRRTHMTFSHTAKGQPYNLPLLAAFLKPDSPRLIDFELLTDDAGKRMVGFGWFAGFAGVFESLTSMAHSHLVSGIASPFLYTPRPHTQLSLAHLRAALRDVGSQIATLGTPKALGPFIIGVTGTGNVAKGCLAALAELPIQNVAVKDLPYLVNDPDTDLRKIYLVHAKPSDYLVNASGTYSRDDYYANPDSYVSTFASSVAPYLTLFLNGAGWAPGFPRLMSNEQLVQALKISQSIGGFRFTNIGDISCDPEGGLEFMTHSTTLCSPSFVINPSPELPPVRIMSVDILPTSVPLDASKHFSHALLPYLRSVTAGYAAESSELDGALDRATIAENGHLKERHLWLKDLAENAPKSVGFETLPAKAGKRVLILGSGMVAGPAVDKIARRGDVKLTIASNSLAELRALSRPYDNVDLIKMDLNNAANISKALNSADVVISLLPVPLHAQVAELCIENKKHLVTASYISDKMRSLHSRAVAADVVLLNEIGLDPGIDHCSAISMIEKLKAAKKDIVSFVSFCGGLPDFSVDAGNVFKYKFSWSPKGVLSALLNPAVYQRDGEVRKVPEGKLLENYFPSVPVNFPAYDPPKEGVFEGLPNRNSLKYAKDYGLDLRRMKTFMRGTLRYPGFAEAMARCQKAGLLDAEMRVEHSEYLVRLGKIMDAELSVPVQLHPAPTTPVDLFASVLAHNLKYKPHEPDMVVLSHELTTVSHVGEEVYTSVLYLAGDERYSAMAKTVGLPVAIAALLLLDGKVAARGVMGPGGKSIRKPVLRQLRESGVVMQERTFVESELEDMRRRGRVTRMGWIGDRREMDAKD